MYEESVFSRVRMNMLCRARQCWEQGIAAIAMMELEEIDWLLAMCDDMLTRQASDGRLCIIENNQTQTDPVLCVQPLMCAWHLTNDERYLKGVQQNYNALLHSTDRTSDGILYHILGLPELWADSAAMLPPSLAAMGQEKQAVRQMLNLCDRLHLENGLYGHRWNDATKCWVRKQPWAAGNGWILVGLAWTMRYLGREHTQTTALLQRYNDLTMAMIPWRLASGFYRNILNEPDSFEECQTATMQAYSNMILFELGLWNEDTVQEALAILQKVGLHMDRHGAIHDCPGSPTFTENGTSTEMQAFWLMLYAMLKRAGAV